MNLQKLIILMVGGLLLTVCLIGELRRIIKNGGQEND